MKRILTRAVAPLAIVGLAVGLAGCSTEAPAEEATGPLTVWVMGDSGTNFESLVAPYVEESGQEVEVVAIPWDSIDEKLTTALLDRLAHHATVITTKGKSYRMRKRRPREGPA